MVDLPITKWIKKKIRRLIAIVEDTDVATHSIASGKYVVWKGDLCKSTAAIAVGGSLSLSNLSPVSDGGLNELSEQIAGLSIRSVSYTFTVNAGARVTTNLKTLIDADLPTGKKCLGIVGYHIVGNINVFANSVRYEDNAYSLQMFNLGDSNLSNQKINIDYLCI